MQGDRWTRDRSQERRDRERRDDRDRDRRDRERDSSRERRRGGGSGGFTRDREVLAERERQAGRPSGRLPPRAPSNPLIAEAYKLAKQQLEKQRQQAEQSGDDDDEPVERPPSRGWRAAEQEEEDRDGSPEDGELPASAAAAAAAAPSGGKDAAAASQQPGAAAGPAAGKAAGGGGGEAEAAKKRKHAPIVWHTPPKVPKTLAHSGSSKGLEGMAGGGGGGKPGAAAAAGGGGSKSAADRAMEELLAFQQQQQAAAAGGSDAEDDGQPYMKPSPSVSSEEEAEEEEGGRGAGAGQQRSSSGSPAGRAAAAAAGGGEEQEEEEEALTAPTQPKRASRWTEQEAAEEGGGRQQQQQQRGGASPGGGAPAADASSDAERQQQESGSGGGDEEGDGEESPRGFKKRAVNMLEECRSVETYEKLNRISEGTYGVVYRARDRETGEICALKKVKLEKERDGFPLTSIREINILLSLNHPHIVNVSEVVVSSSLDGVFMVMEYADHDLKAVMEERMTQPFSTAEVKTLMLQLLSGMAYLHENWVLHRDLKTSNILYTNRGELKLCDFGLARQYGSPLAAYTHMVVTLWYRAPELLLGQRKYSTAVDVWSIGCIMAELLSKEALFAGKSELDQLQIILKTMGSPTEESWPGLSQLPNARKLNLGKHPPGGLRQKFPPAGLGFDGRPPLSEQGFHLLSSLLELCPERRISCAEALDHPWFREHPLPKDKALMPTFPATNDTTQQRHAAQRRAAAKAAAAAAAAGKKDG